MVQGWRSAYTFNVGPGLTTTPGTQNTGTQAVPSGATISGQFWPVAKATNYTVVAADTGNKLIMTGPGLTATLLPPTTPGATFQFGSDGANPYTVTTPSGIFKGCRGGGPPA
jgi:hypothetical protein